MLCLVLRTYIFRSNTHFKGVDLQYKNVHSRPMIYLILLFLASIASFDTYASAQITDRNMPAHVTHALVRTAPPVFLTAQQNEAAKDNKAFQHLTQKEMELSFMNLGHGCDSMAAPLSTTESTELTKRVEESRNSIAWFFETKIHNMDSAQFPSSLSSFEEYLSSCINFLDSIQPENGAYLIELDTPANTHWLQLNEEAISLKQYGAFATLYEDSVKYICQHSQLSLNKAFVDKTTKECAEATSNTSAYRTLALLKP